MSNFVLIALIMFRVYLIIYRKTQKVQTKKKEKKKKGLTEIKI